MSLSRVQGDAPGVFWVCSSCGGRTATIASLRKNVIRETVNRLWLRARSEGAPRRRDCPACFAPMAEVCLTPEPSEHVIDVCTRCQVVWFDAREYERMPAMEQLPTTFIASLPPEARERFAMLEVAAIQERHDRDSEDDAPTEAWKYIPALFGLPVKYHGRVKDTIPWVTCGLAALIAIVSVAAFYEGESAVRELGLIPTEFSRRGGLTFITSIFLHGGIFHLLSNLYFLVTFGSHVEDSLGRARYTVLLLLAAVMEGAAHVFGVPESTIPCVGASGVISGVLAYYALEFPHARLGWIFRWGLIIRWVNVSARVMFLLWLALQAAGIWQQLQGFSNVSALSHMGGVAAGAVFWAVGKIRAQTSTREYGA